MQALAFPDGKQRPCICHHCPGTSRICIACWPQSSSQEQDFHGLLAIRRLSLGYACLMAKAARPNLRNLQHFHGILKDFSKISLGFENLQNLHGFPRVADAQSLWDVHGLVNCSGLLQNLPCRMA